MPDANALMGGLDTHWTQLRDADVAARAAARRFTPQTPGQEKYWEAMQDRLLVACDGPAGAGKTLLACQMAADLFKAKRVKSLVFLRPGVTAGRPSGMLPGTLAQKHSPFMFVLAGYMARLLPGQRMTVLADPESAADLSVPGVYFLPAEYARGVTLDDCFVFADEAQNFEQGMLRLVTGRQGKNTTLVLSGHSKQCDLPGGPAGWLHLLSLLSGTPDPDWAVVRLIHADVLRSGIAAKTERLWDGEGAAAQPPGKDTVDDEPTPTYADVVRRGPVARRRRPS
jgi:phosphate starvation-inducible protein PhoH